MTAEPSYPEQMELICDSGARYSQIVFQGETFLGAIYTDQQNARCYRVIHSDNRLTVQTRKRLTDLVGQRAAAGCAQVENADTAYCEANQQNYFVLCYTVPGGGIPFCSLLRKNALSYNITCVRMLCNAYSGWKDQQLLPFALTPFDLVIVGEELFLLPYIGAGEIDLLGRVYRTPALLTYLPSEVLIAMRLSDTTQHRLTQYFLGIMLLNCFFEAPAPQSFKTTIENAVLGELPRMFDTLKIPVWQAKIAASETVIALARKMTGRDPQTRGDYAPEVMAQLMGDYLDMLKPDRLLNELRQQPTKEYALLAITDMLSKGSDERLQLMMGDTYADMQNAAMAIDTYGKVYAQYDNKGALLKEFDLIAENIRCRGSLAETMLANHNAAKYYLNIMWQCVNTLPKDPGRTLQMGEFLLWYLQNNLSDERVPVREYLHQEYLRLSQGMLNIQTMRLGAIRLELLAADKDASFFDELERFRKNMIYCRENNLATLSDLRQLGDTVNAISNRL